MKVTSFRRGLGQTAVTFASRQILTLKLTSCTWAAWRPLCWVVLARSSSMASSESGGEVRGHRANSQVDNSSLIWTPRTTHASDPDPTRPCISEIKPTLGGPATKNLQIENLVPGYFSARNKPLGSFLKQSMGGMLSSNMLLLNLIRC